MQIIEDEQNGVHILKVAGRVDTGYANEMDSFLHTAAAEGKTKMVLDLSELAYISSAGLRSFADILSLNKAQGGDLKLAAVNPKILRILQIIGFDQFFSIYDSVDEAVAAF
jgi:anti-anti-sigma factor